MNPQNYQESIDSLFEKLDWQVGDYLGELDCDMSGGIFTFECCDKTSVILTRQAPLLELWVAAKSGGFHLSYDDATKHWICSTTSENLTQLLTRVIFEQGGEDFIPEI